MTAAFRRANRRTFASLRHHRNYRLFFAGQIVSVSGTWMQNIAAAWLVLQLTHSPGGRRHPGGVPVPALHALSGSSPACWSTSVDVRRTAALAPRSPR